MSPESRDPRDVTDHVLWEALNQQVFLLGREDRGEVCRLAATVICIWFGVTDDTARESIRGRIDRLWAENMGIRGVA